MKRGIIIITLKVAKFFISVQDRTSQRGQTAFEIAIEFYSPSCMILKNFKANPFLNGYLLNLGPKSQIFLTCRTISKIPKTQVQIRYSIIKSVNVLSKDSQNFEY